MDEHTRTRKTLEIQNILLLEGVLSIFRETGEKMPKNLLEDVVASRSPIPKATAKSAKFKAFVKVSLRKEMEDNEIFLSHAKAKYFDYLHGDRNEKKYYGGGNHHTLFISDRDDGASIDENLKTFMREKGDGKAFTYHRKIKELSWLNTNTIHSEFKRFKKMIKRGELCVRKENNNEVQMAHCERKWYSLVIQFTDEENDTMDIAGVKIFQYMVDGLCYFFDNEKNRDKMYKWIIN